MVEEQETGTVSRRKRVNLIKKTIILALLGILVLPVVLCVVLFGNVHRIEKQLSEMTDTIAEIGRMQSEIVQHSLQENASNKENLTFSRMSEAQEKSNLDGREVLTEEGKEIAEEGTIEGSAIEDSTVKVNTIENNRKVYLTFDDGPSSNTAKILDILRENDVKATFFVIGKESDYAKKLYKRIVEEGHTLGIHSYSHKYDEIYADFDSYVADLNKLSDYLFSVTGVRCQYLRFPGGSSNKVCKMDMQDCIDYVNEEGYTYFDWNISSGDADSKPITPEQIVENCMEGLDSHKNAVILMHDFGWKDATVNALPELIKRIKEMENTVLLPIDEKTVPVQHRKSTQEHTKKEAEE